LSTTWETDDASTARLLMVHDLHRAIHGYSTARPESPQQVWEVLLAEVRRLAATAEHPYRLVVCDPRNAGVPVCFNRATYYDAYAGWVLLHDHGHDGISVVIERRTPDGWEEIPGSPPPAPE
jgi:hypothetical protein